MRPRARSRILANLETVYREAYNRAKEAGDKGRMIDLDSAYQREQLLLEVLLDIRDGLQQAPVEPDGIKNAVEKLQSLQRLTKLKG
jgi:hypothetical protein